MINRRDRLFVCIGIAGDVNRLYAISKVFEAMETITTVLLLSFLAGFEPG